MQISEIKLDGQSVVLAKSLGYMNESGGPVKSLADLDKIDIILLILLYKALIYCPVLNYLIFSF
jgi:PTH1 family peptidyl-tRNA hydrolase